MYLDMGMDEEHKPLGKLWNIVQQHWVYHMGGSPGDVSEEPVM